jgi:hypothetical protein
LERRLDYTSLLGEKEGKERKEYSSKKRRKEFVNFLSLKSMNNNPPIIIYVSPCDTDVVLDPGIAVTVGCLSHHEFMSTSTSKQVAALCE